MLKSLIVASAMIVATSAFAQTTTKSPGSSQYAPGQQMQNSTSPSTAPGASEYAPGQQNDTTGPGHSASAPGQQTTGSSAGTGSGMSTKSKSKY